MAQTKARPTRGAAALHHAPCGECETCRRVAENVMQETRAADDQRREESIDRRKGEARIRKHQARLDREADYAEAVQDGRDDTVTTAASVERMEALRWAEENGVSAKWLDASLKKMQRSRTVRAAGFDPDTGKALSDSTTGGTFLDWRKPVGTKRRVKKARR